MLRDNLAEKQVSPRFLVLLASRNGAIWIERQISSVLAQKKVTVQVDVRDDDSCDDTRQLVAKIAEADHRVRLRSDHRSTGSAAQNFFRLITETDAYDFDFFAFCDQDDEWFADKLIRASERLNAVGADGYSAAVKAQWINGRELLLAQNQKQRTADYLFEGAGQGCTFVLTRRLFIAIKSSVEVANDLLSAIHYHDWLAYAVARSLGLSWYVDAQVVMIYHQHAKNDTGARGSWDAMIYRLTRIRRGWYLGQVSAVVAFLQRVNPDDFNVQRWQTLSSHTLPFSAARRLAFVALHGRRRLSDRFVQIAAIMGGYL